MLLFVIPKITSMYVDMAIELPLPTKVLIGMSNFLIKDWWLVLIAVGAALFGLKRFKKTKIGRYALARLGFKLPIFGRVSMQTDLVEFSSTLGLLLSSGVPITDALEIVAGSVKNPIYRDIILGAIGDVRKGVPLSSPLSKSKYMPQIVPQMLAVGEETGKVDEILFKLAVYFQLETDQLVKNLSTAMEPLIMVMLGVMVGTMILAIILPIYKLTSSFS